MDKSRFGLDKSKSNEFGKEALGMDQFCKLSKESQSLAMFKVLEENGKMLKSIISSEERRKHADYNDKVNTVEINVGGARLEVMLGVYYIEIIYLVPGTHHHPYTATRDQAIQG